MTRNILRYGVSKTDGSKWRFRIIHRRDLNYRVMIYAAKSSGYKDALYHGLRTQILPGIGPAGLIQDPQLFFL